MSDNEIRQILIERKRQERKMQRREERKELAMDALAWLSWAVGGYMLYLLTYAAM